VTLAVHPRFGEDLAIVGAYGRSAVWVETFDGGDLRMLPLSWTSRHPRPEPLASQGRAVRLAPEALRELAAWVAARASDAETAIGRKVGHFDKCVRNRHPDGSGSDGPAGELASSGTGGDDLTESGRCSSGGRATAAVVGQAGSPGAQCRKQRKRGMR
jgi:hypothetical protein